MSERTNILTPSMHIFVLSYLLWNINKNHLINVKILLVYGILNIYQLDMYNPSQIFQRWLR